MRTVLKIGGSILEPAPAPALMGAIARASAAGRELVIVHGGGKALSGLLQRLGVETEFRQGLRVTGPETLRAAVMAFAGEVNTRLVAALNAAASPAARRAVGLTGVDAGCLVARIEQPELGAVGNIVGGDPGVVLALLGAGYLPVMASLAGDGEGGILNVNADQFAAAVAAAIGAERLLFTTDVDGVLDRAGAPIPRVTLAELEAMAASGAIHGGMLPKADACRTALSAGVAAVEIIGAAAALQLDRLLAGAPAAGTKILA